MKQRMRQKELVGLFFENLVDIAATYALSTGDVLRKAQPPPSHRAAEAKRIIHYTAKYKLSPEENEIL